MFSGQGPLRAGFLKRSTARCMVDITQVHPYETSATEPVISVTSLRLKIFGTGRGNHAVET